MTTPEDAADRARAAAESHDVLSASQGDPREPEATRLWGFSVQRFRDSRQTDTCSDSCKLRTRLSASQASR